MTQHAVSTNQRTRASKLAFFLINAIVIFTALAYGAVHQPIIVLFYLLVAAAAIVWAADALAGGSSPVRFSRSWFQLVIAAYALYGVAQAIPFGDIASTAGLAEVPRTISQQPHATLATSVHILILLVFFSVTLTTLDSAKRIQRFVAVLTVFGAVFAFFAILQGVLSPAKIYGIYERQFATPYGSFVNRHNFAAYMEMTIAVPLAMLLTGAVARDKRLLYVTAIALMGIALLLSGSRGGLVALLAEIAILLFLTTTSRTAKGIAIKAALAIALLIAVIGGAIFVGGESSLSRFAETAGSEDVSSNRTHIWDVTVEVIRQNLPLGAGIGAFDTAYTRYDTSSGLERVEQAHNDYLQVLADAGVPGLVIGIAFLVVFIAEVKRVSRRKNLFRRGVGVGAAAAVSAVLVHSLFDFVLHTTAISALFLGLLAVLVACGYRYDDDIEDDEHKRSRRSPRGIVSPLRAKRRLAR
ncbi:MAG: O-antigen ligase family protein [Pyrinomonadaceae bacterium]